MAPNGIQLQIKNNVDLREHLLSLKEQKYFMPADIAQKVADKMQDMSASYIGLDMDNINLYCSLFENNQMRIPQNREAGDILLQPLLEHNSFMRDRCISAYIISVRDDKEALLRLEDVIRESSSADKYLNYISNLKEKSTIETRKGYLENKDMRFITTNIIDIDGTLDYGRELCKTEGRSGGRQQFNQHLIGMIVEHPDDDFAICTRRIFTPRDRLNVCNNLIRNCQEFLEDEPNNKSVAKFMQLLQSGKIKAYSKRDLMNNEHICLAGSITDDEMPEILGIQSLSDATVSVYKSRATLDDALQPLWNAVPADRKVTLQQLEDEKMLPMRIEYLQNPEMKFITTELIDQEALLTPSKKLDENIINLLLNKKEDWAVVYFAYDKISDLLVDNADNDTICKFKDVLEKQEKIVNQGLIKSNDICLVKPLICSNGFYKINALTDASSSLLYEPSKMDVHIKKAYDKIPDERKITLKQYLEMKEKAAELENNPAVQGALDRVQIQKQKLDNRKGMPDKTKDSGEKTQNLQQITPNKLDIMKKAKDDLVN